MAVLVARGPGVVDAGSGEQERVTHAALEGVPLPAAEGRVAGEGPPPRVVAARREPPQVVEVGELVVEVVGLVGDVVAQLVVGPVRPAFGRRPVVRHAHDDGAIELTGRLEMVEDPADLVVGVGHERGEHLHHPGVQALSGPVDRRPLLDPRRSRRQRRPLGQDARSQLTPVGRLPPDVPPGVEPAAEAFDPLGRRLVRRVRRPGSVPEEEGALRMGEPKLPKVGDGVVGQVGLEVVALLRGPGRLHVVGVPHQVRRPLVRLPVEEPVVAVESEPRRPHAVGAGVPLVPGHEVPLAHAEGGVAVGPEDLGQGPRRAGEMAGVTGEVGGQVGQHPHADPVVVPPGEQARSGGRADRRGVEVGEAESAAGQPVQVGGVEVRAVGAEVGEAEVVEDDHHDVRRIGAVRLGRGHPVGLGHRQWSRLVGHRHLPYSRRPAGPALPLRGTRTLRRARGDRVSDPTGDGRGAVASPPWRPSGCSSDRTDRSAMCSPGPPVRRGGHRLPLGGRPPGQPLRRRRPLVRRVDPPGCPGHHHAALPPRTPRVHVRPPPAAAHGPAGRHRRRPQRRPARPRSRTGRRGRLPGRRRRGRRRARPRRPLRARSRDAPRDPGRCPSPSHRCRWSPVAGSRTSSAGPPRPSSPPTRRS